MKLFSQLSIALILISCGGTSPIIESEQKNIKGTTEEVSTNAEDTVVKTSNAIEDEIEKQKNIASNSGIIGKWTISVDSPRGKQTNGIEIKKVNGQLKVFTDKGNFPIMKKDNDYVWENERDTPRGKMKMRNTATLNGDRLNGTIEIISGSMSGRTMSFVGVRK